MVDTPTKLADAIVPEIFNPYVIEATVAVNAFFAAGIVTTVPELAFGERGGLHIEMPFWKALGERAQLLDDNRDLVIKKITAGQDTAVQHARGLVYGATDLSAALSGSDPMKAVGDGLAGNWSMEFNYTLIASLRGAMAGVTANTHDISSLPGAAGNIDATSFVDAAQKLGDHKDQIAGIVMHSAVEAQLAKNDLIDTIRDSEGNMIMKVFMSKRVVVDDALVPLSGDIYEAYLFGPGAIGYGEGSPKVPSETMRDPLKNSGQEYVVSRRHYVLHPRGIRWTPVSGVPALQTPSDAELSNPANWTQVYNQKHIRIVRFVFRI